MNEIDVEQDRHRLELAHDDVAQDADEGENPLRVRYSSRQLTARALPFLEQPLERALKDHASHPYRMQQHEQTHPRSAEAAVDGHLLTGRYGERDSLGVSIQQVHVARATRQSTR
jgi:hypothetical protein